MANSASNFLWNFLLLILCHVLGLQFTVKAIGIGMDTRNQQPQICRSTVPSRHLIADDHGYVCNVFSHNSSANCCPEMGDKFPCHGCKLVSKCCNSYEYCVSCCLSPNQTKEELALQVKIAKPVSAGTYASVFEFCAGRCRHDSANVHGNAYVSDYHHCFSLPSSVAKDTLSETRLTGINVIVGRQGESCNSACRAKGQACVPNKLLLLNTCEFLQKYMSCESSCIASVGSDQPAEIVIDAPKHMKPGACLYNPHSRMLSCDGSHPHSRRLCPCA